MPNYIKTAPISKHIRSKEGDKLKSEKDITERWMQYFMEIYKENSIDALDREEEAPIYEELVE